MTHTISEPKRSVASVVVFTSPKAGSGVGREHLPRLDELLQSRGIQVDTTSKVDELRQRTSDIDSISNSIPVVVAAGGDGTLSLVAETVPNNVPIVPMPMGTENLLARHLGHRADADSVFDAVCSGVPHRIDAGRANGKLFLVMATCGFDAEVVRAMHLTRRGHISRFSYTVPILRALRRYKFPRIHVHVDGTESGALIGCWAMVFNFPCYGGHLKIEPDANGHDGLFDILTFRKGSILSGFRYLAGVAIGRHKRFGDVTSVQGTTIRLSSDHRVPYQLDGDYGGHLPLDIEMLPSQVQLLLPPERGDRTAVARS